MLRTSRACLLLASVFVKFKSELCVIVVFRWCLIIVHVAQVSLRPPVSGHALSHQDMNRQDINRQGIPSASRQHPQETPMSTRPPPLYAPSTIRADITNQSVLSSANVALNEAKRIMTEVQQIREHNSTLHQRMLDDFQRCTILNSGMTTTPQVPLQGQAPFNLAPSWAWQQPPRHTAVPAMSMHQGRDMRDSGPSLRSGPVSPRVSRAVSPRASRAVSPRHGRASGRVSHHSSPSSVRSHSRDSTASSESGDAGRNRRIVILREPQIRKFAGGDNPSYKEWRAEINDHLRVIRGGHRELIACLRGDARREVENAEEEDRRSVKAILRYLDSIYGEKKSIQRLLGELYQRKQRNGESLREYGSSLVKIFDEAAQRQPTLRATKNATLIGVFVEGIEDRHLRRECKREQEKLVRKGRELSFAKWVMEIEDSSSEQPKSKEDPPRQVREDQPARDRDRPWTRQGDRQPPLRRYDQAIDEEEDADLRAQSAHRSVQQGRPSTARPPQPDLQPQQQLPQDPMFQGHPPSLPMWPWSYSPYGYPPFSMWQPPMAQPQGYGPSPQGPLQPQSQGHLRQLPQDPTPQPREPRCFKCKSPSHFIADCPGNGDSSQEKPRL